MKFLPSLFLVIFIIFPESARALSVANYYLPKAGLQREHLTSLARYDLLVVPAEWQEWHMDEMLKLKIQNPKLKLLAYVPSRGFNQAWTDPLHRELDDRLEEHHYLHDAEGRRVSVWIGVHMMNMTGTWPEVLARFVTQKIIPNQIWDGIFYDEIDEVVSGNNRGNIDSDSDGLADHPGLLDAKWREGVVRLLRETRERSPRAIIIVTNGSSRGEYQAHTNGRLFEDFPTPWEGRGRWLDSMNAAQRIAGLVAKPSAIIFNGTTGNTGNFNDVRRVRFTVGSALLVDTLPSFDFGTRDHGQRVWYSVYDRRVGEPLTGPKNLSNPNLLRIVSDDLWRRDFTEATVLVNASKKKREVVLEESFGRRKVKINPQDAIIVARKVR